MYVFLICKLFRDVSFISFSLEHQVYTDSIEYDVKWSSGPSYFSNEMWNQCLNILSFGNANE